jgi:hypothetical protein
LHSSELPDGLKEQKDSDQMQHGAKTKAANPLQEKYMTCLLGSLLIRFLDFEAFFIFFFLRKSILRCPNGIALSRATEGFRHSRHRRLIIQSLEYGHW